MVPKASDWIYLLHLKVWWRPARLLYCGFRSNLLSYMWKCNVASWNYLLFCRKPLCFSPFNMLHLKENSLGKWLLFEMDIGNSRVWFRLESFHNVFACQRTSSYKWPLIIQDNLLSFFSVPLHLSVCNLRNDRNVEMANIEVTEPHWIRNDWKTSEHKKGKPDIPQL